MYEMWKGHVSGAINSSADLKMLQRRSAGRGIQEWAESSSTKGRWKPGSIC